MKQLFRPLYREIKKIIRKIAFKILVKVDDAFLDNYKVQLSLSENLNIHEDGQSTSKEDVLRSKPPIIFINEEGTLVSSEMLQVVFNAITHDWPQVIREDLWQHLLQNKAKISVHEDLFNLMRDQLLSWLQKEQKPDLGDCAFCLDKLLEHKKRTDQNSRAYSTSIRQISHVFWPDPTFLKSPRSLYDEVPFVKSIPIVDKQVPIGSAGSCFAMEIAHKLQEQGFNYVVTEPHIHPVTGFSNSCTQWGTIFNTPSFRQLIEYGFGHRRLPRILWSQKQEGKRIICDPFREDVQFSSQAEYEATYDSHLLAVREALTQSKVFILTLGMNEVWFFKGENVACSRSPWRLASYLVEKKVLSVHENVLELQKMLDIWRKYNPDLKLIISVSPVPLHATFRADEYHVIEANCHSKSILRVAAEQFVAQNEGVYYFPSYETVMYCTQNPWDKDQRHVSRQTVQKVMNVFNKMFVSSKSQLHL